MISEALRVQRRDAGAVGGHSRWARHPDLIPDPRPAGEAYRASFLIGHGGDPDTPEYADVKRRDRPVGLCRACPKRVEIAPTADLGRREDMAKALRRQHYRRIAALAVAARRRTG